MTGPYWKRPSLDNLVQMMGALAYKPVAAMTENAQVPFACQVGISAGNVVPEVNIACGTLGASQNVKAMRDSGTIIFINKDPNAPIFRVAD